MCEKICTRHIVGQWNQLPNYTLHPTRTYVAQSAYIYISRLYAWNIILQAIKIHRSVSNWLHADLHGADHAVVLCQPRLQVIGELWKYIVIVIFYICECAEYIYISSYMTHTHLQQLSLPGNSGRKFLFPNFTNVIVW